jgi:hypothetical protein
MQQILSILWEILSILWEICYLIGIFCNHSFPPPPPPPLPVDNNFGKFLRKIVFDNAGTIRKSRANFFPPPSPNFSFPYAHGHEINVCTPRGLAAKNFQNIKCRSSLRCSRVSNRVCGESDRFHRQSAVCKVLRLSSEIPHLRTDLVS